MSNYLKYDNNYWNRNSFDEIKKSLFRVSLASLIAFEGFCIIQAKTPTKGLEQIINNITPVLSELIEEFPTNLISDYQLKKDIKKTDFKIDSQIKDIKLNIKNIIKEAHKERFTELGGIFQYKGGKVYTHLIKSKNHIISEQILNSRTKTESLINIYCNNKEEFVNEFGISFYEKAFDHFKTNQDINLINNIMIRYISTSQRLYSPDLEKIGLFASNSNLDVMGIFHVHKNGYPPSPADLDYSKNIRAFVISDKKSGFIVYDLKKGKLNSVIKVKY